MRAFLIFTLCAGLAVAKPQYNYPAPQKPSGSYVPSYTGFSGAGTAVAQGVATGFGGGQGQAGFSGNIAIGGEALAAGIGGSAAGIGGGATYPSVGPVGGTLVQKHIYVHVAPPEPEETRVQRPISAGQATKHYKIIFIKAPSYPSYQQQLLQAQAQNEEKTLVYVLVKKPDEIGDITVPTAAPTAPSKPEVYFIRYKAKSEVSGGGAAAGGQLSGAGTGLGGGASLSLSSSSGASTQFNAGASTSSFSAGRPSTSYGPPGQSGPY